MSVLLPRALQMDDWYVTHALLNQTRAIYFDLQSHYISTDSLQEFNEFTGGKFKRRRLLFGHFRPKSRLVDDYYFYFVDHQHSFATPLLHFPVFQLSLGKTKVCMESTSTASFLHLINKYICFLDHC